MSQHYLSNLWLCLKCLCELDCDIKPLESDESLYKLSLFYRKHSCKLMVCFVLYTCMINAIPTHRVD